MLRNEATHKSSSLNSLLVVIMDKGKGSELFNYAMGLGISGATAFHARGTVPSRILRFFELVEVRKEIVMIALPTYHEKDLVHQLTVKFQLDRPNKGIIFSLNLSGVYGSSHFDQDSLQVSAAEAINDSPYQAIMTIVDKGRADSILDFVEEHGFARGTVIDAHGSADKSKVILNLMFEREKEIFLIITKREQARRLAGLLTDFLDLRSVNCGIMALLNIRQLVGINTISTENSEIEEMDELGEPGAVMGQNMPGHSLIFAIVDNDQDKAVIQSAELAGSTGGTIIHARGSHPYNGKTFFSNSIEPEREIVMIIAENDKVQAICSRIETDLQLDQPGKGILLVTPLVDTIGLVTN